MDASHYDLVVVLAVSGAVQLTVIVIGFVMLGRMLREAQRLTRAVGALVIQEEARTRTLLEPRRG